MTTIPSGSQYENIIEGFLGTNYSDVQKGFVKQKDLLWSAFLTANGLKPSDPSVILQDPTVLSKFVSFVQQTYDSLQTDALSPDEISRRGLLFSAYDLIVLMIETLQKNVGVTAQNVVFLGKYQQAYSDMMGRVADATYIGGSLSIPKPNTTDLSKWTLGYGGITMNDYLTAAVQNSITGKTTPASTGVAGSTDVPANSIEIHSINYQDPVQIPDVQQVGAAVQPDVLSAVKQESWVALGPATTTSFPNIEPSARDTLRFSYTPTDVTFTYTYMQQYNTTVVPYTIDSDGNIKAQNPINVPSDPNTPAFYPITLTSPAVTFPPGATPEDKQKLAAAAFQAF